MHWTNEPRIQSRKIGFPSAPERPNPAVPVGSDPQDERRGFVRGGARGRDGGAGDADSLPGIRSVVGRPIGVDLANQFLSDRARAVWRLFREVPKL